jgi:hypothetical protein
MNTFLGAIKGNKDEARAKGRGSVRTNKALRYLREHNELEKQKKIAKSNGDMELYKKLHEASEIALNQGLDYLY